MSGVDAIVAMETAEIMTSESAHRRAAVYVAGQVGEQLADPTTPVLRAAFHEAAHAVCALLVGASPSLIAINTNGSGFTSFDVDEAEYDSQRAARVGDDVMLQSLDTARPGEPPLDLEAIRSAVRAALTHHWSLVETIASSLQARIILAERGSMTGGELRMTFELYKEDRCFSKKTN